MPQVSLIDFQKAADEKFGDYEITLPAGDVACFVQAVRLPKAKRRKLAEALDMQARAAQAEAEESDDDIFDMFKDAFRVAAKSAKDFRELEKAVGDDPAIWTDLFNDFVEGSDMGEASPSES